MGVKVLSLFDGMACGMIAMQLAGVDVESYDAYEIDKYAVKTAQFNFPMIKEHGDVFTADFTQYFGVDFLVGGSPCFTKGHLVLTDNGYKDVSEIEVGDMVLTHTGEYHKVVRVNERKCDTVKVRAMGYPSFVTTAEHPFYTLKRMNASYSEYKQSNSWRVFTDCPDWTKAKDLTNNHFVAQHIIDNTEDCDISIEDCWLLGRYIADGHVRKTKRKGRKNSYQYQMIISVGKDKVNTFAEKVTHTHFSFFPHSQSTYRAVFSSMKYVNFIIDNNFGTKAVDKNIPEFIYKLPMEKRMSFLDGYLSGDGCFAQGKYTASTVSPKLAFGLQRLATSIYKTNVSVTVCERSGVHKIDGREIKSNYPMYQILIPTEIKKQSVCHVQGGMVWTQVKTVEPWTEETVYNIEVETDNSYTVNNCIVHNCTYWSIAQTKNRETVASGMGWELFSQYVRALHEAKPKYFIYENNKSMSKQIRASIDEAFGFEAVLINSALVSAQNRQRLYWVGKRNADGTYSKVNVEQPIDRGILLKDVLDGAVAWQNKAYTYTTRCHGAIIENTLERHQHTMVAEPINVTADGKAQCLRSTCYKDGIRNIVANNVDRKTGVAEPVRCMNFELKETYDKDSGCVARLDMPGSHDICTRVYGKMGKSPIVNTCGGGNLEPKIFDDIPVYGYIVVFNDDGKPVKAIGKNGKETPVYEVKNGEVTVKGKQYPIKLEDGYYIIRKLTVTECKRLQTVPEWYDFSCVSNTQAFKMLGNGWTCEIIKHLIASCLSA